MRARQQRRSLVELGKKADRELGGGIEIVRSAIGQRRFDHRLALSGNGFRQKSLTSSRRTFKKNTFRNSGPYFNKLGRVPQKFYDFFQFFLFFLEPGYVFEGDLILPV